MSHMSPVSAFRISSLRRETPAHHKRLNESELPESSITELLSLPIGDSRHLDIPGTEIAPQSLQYSVILQWMYEDPRFVRKFGLLITKLSSRGI